MEIVDKLGIIPARYASTRFPGKPLATIGGVPMIERVYKQAVKSNLDKVLVATDDERIADCVKGFGGNVVMTNPDLPTGTDRCREALALSKIKARIVVNIQGDEPFIDPEQINAIVQLLHGHDINIATMISPALTREEIENPNRVKVVTEKNGKALYFSRSPIPYSKNMEDHISNYAIHLGIYGFRGATLRELGQLNTSFLERSESLEQLRWLENGYSIYTVKTNERADSVDTPEDLENLEKKFSF